MGVEGKACLFLKTVDPGVRTEKVEYFNQFKTNKTNNSLFTQQKTLSPIYAMVQLEIHNSFRCENVTGDSSAIISTFTTY